MRIYVASSWRNTRQPSVVKALRAEGHEVYDFRDHGFGWHEIDEDWQSWSPSKYRDMLDHPRAAQGFGKDKGALDWADATVLVAPCGRSAHLEIGYAMGQGKFTAILLEDRQEPELMYRLATSICLGVPELVQVLAAQEARR